jgi:proline iminopeptidase
MSIAEVNGTTLFHEIVGTGPTCLVLHGGLGVDHTFYRSLDRLAHRLRLVYLDHRGNGRSGRPPPATITIEQLADDAAALGRIVADGPIVVLGHSYGGFVAQELVLRHQDQVAGLILLDTTPGQLGLHEDPSADQGPPPPPDLAALLATAPANDEELEATMRQLLAHYLHRADPAVLEPLLDGTIFAADACVRGFEVLASWSSVDRLPSIRCPTLVVVGRHDPVTSPPQSVRMASLIAGADLAVLEHSGHMPWIDEPEQTFAVIEGWLDQIP